MEKCLESLSVQEFPESPQISRNNSENSRMLLYPEIPMPCHRTHQESWEYSCESPRGRRVHVTDIARETLKASIYHLF